MPLFLIPCPWTVRIPPGFHLDALVPARTHHVRLSSEEDCNCSPQREEQSKSGWSKSIG